jgi:enoyl-CoA hydratase/carnithine racemase
MEEQRVTSTDSLLVDQGNDGVTVVRLNRPDALNAANEQLHGAIAEVWSETRGRPRLPGRRDHGRRHGVQRRG